jgi:two-component system, NtrC family, sensor kinase
MQIPQKFSFLESLKQTPPTSFIQSNVATYSDIVVNPIQKFIRRLSIHRKIAYGYAFAIGVAVLGTGSGLAVGDYYEYQAKAKLNFSHQQEDILQHLETEVILARSHSERIIPFLENPVWLETEITGLFEQILQIEKSLVSLQNLVKQSPPEFYDKSISKLAEDYETHVLATTPEINELLFNLQQKNLTKDNLPEFKNKLRQATEGNLSIKLEQFYQSLEDFIQKAKQQESKANDAFNNAQLLRIKITVISMLISVALAAILAYYTSHAIARPLKWVTEVADRAAKDQNYHLRAPILTNDEVGVLAVSINQLIETISKQLKHLQETQTQLIQTEKMSSLGNLVAGIAHEVNNPINFIYGNLEYTRHYVDDLMGLVHLYQQYYPDADPEIQKYIETIDFEFLVSDLPKVVSSMTMGAERIRNIVLSLRNFSRLDESEVKQVDIHEGINNTILMLSHRLNHPIKVTDIYGEIPLISCYPALLNQVFLNILTNGIDAIEEALNHGNFSGKDSKKTAKIPQIIIRTELFESNMICIRFWNNGPIIPYKIQRKLFDPFFTTKPPGQGTGLGLAIAYQIITKHGGRIEVFSEDFKGTEFAIFLPIESELIR